jgi:ATP-dependent helicase/nuclease subunit A
MPMLVSPSRALDEPAVSLPGAADERRAAILRGTLVHRLMQSLPDVAAERRSTAARRYLERASSEFSEIEREAMVAQVLGLVNDPRFAPLAGGGSRAEVPIVGRIARPGRPPLLVSGQVDRLAVTPDTVVIADYKTNRPAPRRLAEVPDAYVAQLALYRAVLARLYPGRALRALLVWTDVPDFMELPGAALEAALKRVTAE